MKIKEIHKMQCESITFVGGLEYSRFSSGYWENEYGHEITSPEELETQYQEYISQKEPAKNKIIRIGNIGQYKCYLNISREEAIRRYEKSSDDYPVEEIIIGLGSNPEEGWVIIEEIEFDSEFGSYDIWVD